MATAMVDTYPLDHPIHDLLSESRGIKLLFADDHCDEQEFIDQEYRLHEKNWHHQVNEFEKLSEIEGNELDFMDPDSRLFSNERGGKKKKTAFKPKENSVNPRKARSQERYLTQQKKRQTKRDGDF